jgi:hypothetical protein
MDAKKFLKDVKIGQNLSNAKLVFDTKSQIIDGGIGVYIQFKETKYPENRSHLSIRKEENGDLVFLLTSIRQSLIFKDIFAIQKDGLEAQWRVDDYRFDKDFDFIIETKSDNENSPWSTTEVKEMDKNAKCNEKL